MAGPFALLLLSWGLREASGDTEVVPVDSSGTDPPLRAPPPHVLKAGSRDGDPSGGAFWAGGRPKEKGRVWVGDACE